MTEESSACRRPELATWSLEAIPEHKSRVSPTPSTRCGTKREYKNKKHHKLILLQVSQEYPDKSKKKVTNSQQTSSQYSYFYFNLRNIFSISYGGPLIFKEQISIGWRGLRATPCDFHPSWPNGSVLGPGPGGHQGASHPALLESHECRSSDSVLLHEALSPEPALWPYYSNLFRGFSDL